MWFRSKYPRLPRQRGIVIFIVLFRNVTKWFCFINANFFDNIFPKFFQRAVLNADMNIVITFVTARKDMKFSTLEYKLFKKWQNCEFIYPKRLQSFREGLWKCIPGDCFRKNDFWDFFPNLWEFTSCPHQDLNCETAHIWFYLNYEFYEF